MHQVSAARNSSIGPGLMWRMTRLNVKDRTYAEFFGRTCKGQAGAA